MWKNLNYQNDQPFPWKQPPVDNSDLDKWYAIKQDKQVPWQTLNEDGRAEVRMRLWELLLMRSTGLLPSAFWWAPAAGRSNISVARFPKSFQFAAVQMQSTFNIFLLITDRDAVACVICFFLCTMKAVCDFDLEQHARSWIQFRDTCWIRCQLDKWAGKKIHLHKKSSLLILPRLFWLVCCEIVNFPNDVAFEGSWQSSADDVTLPISSY